MLLNDELLPAAATAEKWRAIGFDDEHEALQTLHRLTTSAEATAALRDCLPTLLHALQETGNPDRVLINLQRLGPAMPDETSFWQHLANHPRAVEIIVILMAGSQFLTEILLRHPEYFERLVNHKHLATPQTPADFHQKAEAALAAASTFKAQLDALRQFQRWQLLRIGTSDLLGLLDMPTVVRQLSHLADAIIQTCLNLITEHYHIDPDGFAVLGMGKLGGEELNYSSDIDLVFLSRDAQPYYHKLGERLVDALTRVTEVGFLYRVDMRLRPWGRVGPLVTSLSAYLIYLENHARLWEKQALIKGRVVAGNHNVGREFLRRAETFIFSHHHDIVHSDVRQMKQRIESELQKNGRGWGEVKLGQGSIRDVEFVTQYLQLAFGDVYPGIRSHNTLDALARLAASNFLSPDEHRVLSDGYTFLRPVEHWLQMMHYRQTHSLPDDETEIGHLARRLGFRGDDAGVQFLAQYNQHTSAIRQVYHKHLGSAEMHIPDPIRQQQAEPDALDTHVASLSSTYVDVFTEHEILAHLSLVEQLGDDNQVLVKALPLADERWQITIVGYDYPGELSLICGLLLVHGFNIIEGQVFTYQPPTEDNPRYTYTRQLPHHFRRRRQTTRPPAGKPRPRIIDVFTVRPVDGTVNADFWSQYEKDLSDLLTQLETQDRIAVQAALAKRVAEVILRISPNRSGALATIDIDIDNDSSPERTVLHIDSPDTVGFFYELTNALAMSGIYIDRVSVSSVGNRVHDFLHVTDSQGQKITDRQKQRELRSAIVLIKHFTHLLPHSPNPELAIRHFRQFLAQSFAQPGWPDQLTSLDRPEVLDALARLLGVSDFLWTDFLRMQYANLFPIVRDVDALGTATSKVDLQAALNATLKEAGTLEEAADQLNAFKDREMFRIDMRHILGHITEFGQFSGELSDLADVVISTAYRLCFTHLEAEFGTPSEPGAVFALGKCGGRELGYASDVELMFVYGGSGETNGESAIPNAQFYQRLVQTFLQIVRAKREGAFEIDLRLRPYGNAGSMAVTQDDFLQYFAPGGPAWAYERQALVRLRFLDGDQELGRFIEAARDDFVYTNEGFDMSAMRGMRERQVRHLVKPGTVNAKHSPGGLVDIEYLIQGLQMMHGQANPALRLTNTAAAMVVLRDAGILPAEDFPPLREAHIFLRRLINALRMVEGHAKDLTLPPTDHEEFAFLARRLNYHHDPARLQADLNLHLRRVQEISRRLLG